jgi:hypothetical protein
MKISQIYDNYMIPQNLQKHMLRVASLAEILHEHWIGKEIDSQAIIQACVFHDAAKPMNFDLAKQAQFGMSGSDINRLKELQERLKSKYGSEEHHAIIKICEEIGLSPTAVKLVNNLEWSYIPRLLETNDIESLIPIYCDMRIGPKGILSLNERLSELKERVSAKDYEDNVKNGTALEQVIKNNVMFNVNSITDDQINKRFEKLLNTEI